jgi:lysine-N-methylase
MLKYYQLLKIRMMKMILRMPEYCRNFRCIADKCKDNCCVGWEIDIDSATAEYYESVQGDFGCKLRSNIDKGEVCSFRLKGERCPFLNDSNLCEIIINLGEEKLCQICSDHPRFFEWYSHIKEGGIGLCCEEAARLIVLSEDGFSTYDVPCDDESCDDYNNALYDMLIYARNEIIRTLEDESITLKERVGLVISYAFELQGLADNYSFEKIPLEKKNLTELSDADIKSFLEAFTSLEPIDENWQAYLQSLIDSAEALSENLTVLADKADRYLKNIAVYFIWRYFLKGVYDEEFFSKVMLMAVSVAMIKLMYAEGITKAEVSDDEFYSQTAKNYSKEIEYSEENLEKIYDMVYENPAFGAGNIIAII